MYDSNIDTNGSKLVLVQCEDTRAEFLMVVPHEHCSHILWQALKRSNRLWLIAGFKLADVFSTLATLPRSAALNPVQLLTLIGDEKAAGNGSSGWYSSGAYCESVMRGARLYQFKALYGEEQGSAKWALWYKTCKARGDLFPCLCVASCHNVTSCVCETLFCIVATSSWCRLCDSM